MDGINVLNISSSRSTIAPSLLRQRRKRPGPKGSPVEEVCPRTIQLLASMGGIWEEGMPRALQEAAWPEKESMNMGPDPERLRRSRRCKC